MGYDVGSSSVRLLWVAGVGEAGWRWRRVLVAKSREGEDSDESAKMKEVEGQVDGRSFGDRWFVDDDKEEDDGEDESRQVTGRGK